MLQPDKILYEAEVTATGGRDGKAASDDGLLSVSLSLPKSLGGPGGPGTNPEQLFAAGYAACFLGAVKLVARTRKITPSAEPTVTAKVGMGRSRSAMRSPSNSRCCFQDWRNPLPRKWLPAPTSAALIPTQRAAISTSS